LGLGRQFLINALVTKGLINRCARGVLAWMG
jgi:hypothetical protein